MVSTRGHPRAFPEPPAATPTPRARGAAAAAAAPSSSSPSSAMSKSLSSLDPASPSVVVSTRRSASTTTTGNTSSSHSSSSKWAHTPSNLTLIWLAVSLPLVLWDTGYVLLRPHSMPGGWLHSPVWTPYALYGTVDYIYGFRAWEARNGFTAAQGTLNLVETAGYLWYLALVYAYGKGSEKKGRGAPKGAPKGLGGLVKARSVGGRAAGLAALVGFATSIMTLSKTVLYWLNEAFSGFDNIGHNKWMDLLFLWIIPNGAWLVLPTYMIYVFGREILQGLDVATGASKKRA